MLLQMTGHPHRAEAVVTDAQVSVEAGPLPCSVFMLEQKPVLIREVAWSIMGSYCTSMSPEQVEKHVQLVSRLSCSQTASASTISSISISTKLEKSANFMGITVLLGFFAHGPLPCEQTSELETHQPGSNSMPVF